MHELTQALVEVILWSYVFLFFHFTVMVSTFRVTSIQLEEEVEPVETEESEASPQDRQLIALVRANPLLWNKASGLYKDVEARSRAWGSVRAQLPNPLSGESIFCPLEIKFNLKSACFTQKEVFMTAQWWFWVKQVP